MSASICWAGGRFENVALTTEQWERAVAEAGLDPASVVNPLAYTPEMQRVANEAIGDAEELKKLERIQKYLFDKNSAFS